MKSIYGLLLTLFCLVALCQSVTLSPEYDDAATKLRIFVVHRPLILHCNVTPSFPTLELTWTRNGIKVQELADLHNRFEILTTENKFVIERTVEEDSGTYACELPSMNQKAEFNVVANVAVRLTKETQLIEGESLWIVCRVVGTNPKISWILPDSTTITNSTDHVTLETENGLANSALYIASVRMEDRGNYTCIAENAASNVAGIEAGRAYGMVRIRSKLAPLWPVCGIFAQAFVLFVVLFIYEKFFHEKDDLDDDEDDYTTTKNGAAEKYSRKNKAY